MFCKYCKYYDKGEDGKPGTCSRQLSDIWNGYENLEPDGVGISIENFEPDINVLYVGENFGCIHFKQPDNGL